jgi:hypothetical protein
MASYSSKFIYAVLITKLPFFKPFPHTNLHRAAVDREILPTCISQSKRFGKIKTNKVPGKC